MMHKMSSVNNNYERATRRELIRALQQEEGLQAFPSSSFLANMP